MIIHHFKTIVIIVATCLIPPSVMALELPAAQQLVMRRTIDYIINCEFDSALYVADSLFAVDKSDPTGQFLALFTLGMRDLDYGIAYEPDRFVRSYKAVIKTLDSLEKKQGRTSYNLTIRGFAQSAYSSLYLRQKQYFAAAQTGLDAIANLQSAQKADSLNHDVDFFFGLYVFAKSELKKRLWWIMFWYDENKKEGIARLESCARSAQFAGSAARMSLADIYIREKEYDKAAKLLSELLLQYPKSRYILWSQQKYFEEIADFRQEQAVCEKLIALYTPVPAAEVYYLLARNRLAFSLMRQKLHNEAREQCEIIMKLKDRKNNDVAIKDVIAETQKIINELNQKK